MPCILLSQSTSWDQYTRANRLPKVLNGIVSVPACSSLHDEDDVASQLFEPGREVEFNKLATGIGQLPETC